MRVIKYFAWEGSFIDKIRDIRNSEMTALTWMVFQRTIIAVVFTASPLMVAAAAFTAYTLMGKELTAEVAFTSVAVFNTLRQPLTVMPSMITSFIETKVSIGRIQRFLLKEDLPSNAVNRTALRMRGETKIAARIVDGNFAWGAEKETLKSIPRNFHPKL